jgi:hypothetical protein
MQKIKSRRVSEMIFVRCAQSQKIGVPNNFKVLGCEKQFKLFQAMPNITFIVNNK